MNAHRLLAIGLSILLCHAAPVIAGGGVPEITWDAGGDGTSFGDDDNWDPAGQPTSAHNVVLPGALGSPQTIDLGGVEREVGFLDVIGSVSPNNYMLTNGTLTIFRTGDDAILTRDNGSGITVDADIQFPLMHIGPRFNVESAGQPIVVNGNITTSSSLGAGAGDVNTTVLEITSQNPGLPSSITINGVVSDSSGLPLALTAGFADDSANHRGTVRVTGANTYRGPTIVNGAVLEFNSIGNVDASGIASALGAPRNAADGTIRLGAVDVVPLPSELVPGTLRYIGSTVFGHTSDRAFELQGAGGVLEADASAAGPLTLLGPVSAITAGVKTLELGGDSSFTNTFGGAISNGAGEIELLKTGSGHWRLTGANTHTGDTRVFEGTLSFDGGAVNNIGQVLEVNGSSNIGPANLNIVSGTRVAVSDNFNAGEDVGNDAVVAIAGAGSQLDVTSFTSIARLGTATMTISNGGLLQTDEMEITREGDADGTVTVTGSAGGTPSTLEVLGRLDMGDADETGGTSTLNISAGGHATVGTSFFFAGSSGSTATINASDSGSLLEVGGTYFLGSRGTGTLNLDTGADATSVDVEMGNGTSGTGIANIDGQGTTWAISGQLLVGEFGEGELNITNRGLVSSSNVSIGLNPNSTGTATVTGVGSTWDTQNELVVGGGADAGGTGTLNVQAGATVRVDRTLKVWGDGTVSMASGTIDAETLDLSAPGSTFEMTGGRLSVEFVQGNLDLGGGTFAPGKSIGVTTVNGDYDQQVGATLEIEIGGTTINRFDQLIVTSDASIVGNLELTLADAGAGLFIPAAEDTFTILTSASFFGVFTNVANGARLNTTDGLGSFLVEYSPATDTVVLSQFLASVLAGDYNDDGIVNAADYTVWRDLLGQAVALPNETATLGMVTQEDYGEWVANFGNTPGGGSLSNATVPEPASLAMLLVGALAMCFRRHGALPSTCRAWHSHTT